MVDPPSVPHRPGRDACQIPANIRPQFRCIPSDHATINRCNLLPKSPLISSPPGLLLTLTLTAQPHASTCPSYIHPIRTAKIAWVIVSRASPSPAQSLLLQVKIALISRITVAGLNLSLRARNMQWSSLSRGPGAQPKISFISCTKQDNSRLKEACRKKSKDSYARKAASETNWDWCR
jgi:hypothetical protein